MPPPRLGDFEYLVLLALFRVGSEAYGAVVRREIETHTRRHLGISAVYTTLERLEQKGLVRSWIGDSTAVRGGGRPKPLRVGPPSAHAPRGPPPTHSGVAAGGGL